MRAIKAMIWKEWRENAKWSALAFVALGLATLYSVTRGSGTRDSAMSLNLLGATAPLTMFVVPLLASVLGFLQVGSEVRREQWAFLVHRPVSRTVLFAGKVIAGLSLYFMATLTPVLWLALWMKTPGNLTAPFAWGLLLAPLANILAGVAFYFAAMITAIGSARRDASRILSFVLALGCLLGVNWVSEFWQALVIVLLSMASLGLSAWGSFLTTGTYERQPKIAKIALGTTLFVSIALVVGGFTTWAVNAASQRQRIADFEVQPFYARTDYGIDLSGRILRIEYSKSGQKATTDLQGHPFSKPNTLEKGSLDMRRTAESSDFRSTSRYYERLFPSAYDSPASWKNLHWFYLKSQRRIVGFDPGSKRPIGTIGPQGFLPIEDGVAAPFAGLLMPRGHYIDGQGESGEQVQYLRFPHSIYCLDLDKRTATPIYQAASTQPIQGMMLINFYSGKTALVLLDNDIIRVLTPQGRLLFSTPLEIKDTNSFSLSVSATRNSDRFFFWYESYDWQSSANGPIHQDHISEFSSKGVLLAKHTLPRFPEPDNRPLRPSAWYEIVAPIAEVPPIAMAGATAYAFVDTRLHPTKFNGNSWGEMKRFCLGAVVVGLLWSVLAFFVAKRCSLSLRACWGWSFATFVLGLFGLLSLLALREWPTRVPCLGCGKKRGLNRERCEHCGALFPPSPIDETSIFEDQIDEMNSQPALERV